LCTGGRQRGEQAQNQQHAREDLSSGADVGQHVGVLVSDFCQPVLEPLETRSAPPAEGLLQAVRDEQRADCPAQQHQPEVLGAATVVRPVGVARADIGGLGIGRQGLAVACLHIRQRFRIVDQPESGLGTRLVVGDGGGFEITGVIR
jgi:hypothetical protein